MNVSRKTMKEYMGVAGCPPTASTKMVAIGMVKTADLPRTKQEYRAARKRGELKFRRVQDEHGRWAEAYLDDMLAKGLEGKIQAEIRTGTVFIDHDCEVFLVNGD